MTALPQSAIASARILADWGEARGWEGSDPYDALNATRLVGPLKRSVLGRRLLTQSVKRSPVNLRPLLGIPPRRNAAAMADVVTAYALGGAELSAAWEARLKRAVELLMAMRSEGREQLCWGYHFDVQTRVFFYPSSSPNTIATAFAGLALVDAFECTGDEAMLRSATSVARFFVEEIPQTSSPPGAYFGYLPGSDTAIHNANLLACAVLARVAAHTGDGDLAEAAREGVQYAVARQRHDGSWPYGEEPGLSWVDNFHTGYVLECLMTCASAGLDVDERAIADGLDFARDALFDPDGTPRYQPHRTHPIDIQCVSQAIRTFSLAAARWPERAEQAQRTWDFARRRMRRADGAFVFQRERWGTNRIAHVRWAQTPMLRALVTLAETQRRTAAGSE